MAWSAPITFVANSVLTAAQLNEQLRDNMSETAPAKASTAGRLIVTTGPNQITERAFDQDSVSTAQSTASTAYTDLGTVGPRVTVTTGNLAFVVITARMENGTAGGSCLASFAISGATTQAAADTYAVYHRSASGGYALRASAAAIVAVNPGSNTFTMKYKVGNTGTATFQDRRIQVLGL